ncbi:MAG TPA: ribosome maturation factor RimM [Caulobacterales bacterium]|nr:ribosome maturation factor RimM [Caulobacterales bacterium]
MAVAAGAPRPLTPPKPLAPKQAPAPLSAPKPAPAPELVGESKPVPPFKGKAVNGAVKNLVLVGAIGGAFGVKGEVRLRAFTAAKDGVISYGPLHDEDGKILLRPKSWRELKDGVAVVAPEVKTREQAESWRGKRLYVPRAHLPETAEDEFYIVDLLGCRAESLDGATLGEIVAVWNFGAGDILEFRPPNGGQNVRISFTKQNVPLVDLAGRRVVFDPPAPEPTGK